MQDMVLCNLVRAQFLFILQQTTPSYQPLGPRIEGSIERTFKTLPLKMSRCVSGGQASSLYKSSEAMASFNCNTEAEGEMDTLSFLSPGARTLSLIESEVDAVGVVVVSVMSLVRFENMRDDESRSKAAQA